MWYIMLQPHMYNSGLLELLVPVQTNRTVNKLERQENEYWKSSNETKGSSCRSSLAVCPVGGLYWQETVQSNALVVYSGADLTGAVLRGADVRETIYDTNTIWPVGFSPPVSRIMYMDEKLRGNYIWVRLQGRLPQLAPRASCGRYGVRSKVLFEYYLYSLT
jgi:hypothetical protein